MFKNGRNMWSKIYKLLSRILESLMYCLNVQNAMLIFNQPKFSSLFYGNASFVILMSVMIFFITRTGKGTISFDKFFVRRKLILAQKFNDTRLFIRQNTMYTVLDLTFFALIFAGYASFVVLRSVVIFANRNRKWEMMNLTATD